MKKQISYLILILIAIYLPACQANKPIQFPSITEVKTIDTIGESFRHYAVSTDGTLAYAATGAGWKIADGSVAPLTHFDCSWNAPIKLSPNGLYLSGSNNATGMGIFDIQEGKCYQPENLNPNNPVESWSPESNRFITAQNRIILDYPSFNQVTYPSDYPIDFRKIKNIYGSSNILWDKNSNLPIAEAVTGCESCISWDNPNFPNLQAKTYLEIRSLSVPDIDETSIPIREQLLTFDWITGEYFPIFDPTGEYILIAVEERIPPPPPSQGMTAQQRYEYYYDPKYVKDTVLMLVHWRTKEHIELLRLSQYGQVQSNTILSEMSWSSDGSTIFIPRKNEPPLVLKIKYP